MDGKVLVAFATTHGSTQEIAEFVAAEIRSHGREVELLPAKEVRSVTGYSAVVLGAPLYMFHLHKDALRFLSRFQKALEGELPLAIFAGGPFGENAQKDLPEIQKSLDRELANLPWLKPISVELVGGKFDPAHLRFPWNLVPALKGMPPSDLRDWPAIRAWAGSLPDKFLAVAA